MAQVVSGADRVTGLEMTECLTVHEKIMAGQTFCRSMKGGHGRFLSRSIRPYWDNPSSVREGHGKNGVSGGLFHADSGVSFHICKGIPSLPEVCQDVGKWRVAGFSGRPGQSLWRRVDIQHRSEPPQTISTPCQKGPESGGDSRKTPSGRKVRA